MRPDEAAFYLAKQSEHSIYIEALRTIINLKVNSHSASKFSLILYLDENLRAHVGINASESETLKRLEYTDIFRECRSLTYEHYIYPQDDRPKNKAYERPLGYLDFNDLIFDVVVKEPDGYFIDDDDYFLLPATETDDGYIWQIFIIEDNCARYVGRMTIPKNNDM